MDLYSMGLRPRLSPSPTRPIDLDPIADRSRDGDGIRAWHTPADDFAPPDLDDPFAREQEPPKWRPSQSAAPRPVTVGLPRQSTFRRQNSEKHERLSPTPASLAERRERSSTRRKSLSTSRHRKASSPPPPYTALSSVSTVASHNDVDGQQTGALSFNTNDATLARQSFEAEMVSGQFRPPRPPSRTSSDESYDQYYDWDERARLTAELESKWILNLSMHFRDKSDREKFFVTYAAKPNRWRRVTVSCDYRNAEPGSLETDLKELQYQRDKNMQIYESIRDSLPDIQFYDTVTNLKLETTNNRLHVHVTEDVNEIIPYPPRTTVRHILDGSISSPQEVRESDLEFDSHLSGFVYKVRYQGRDYIKKEIPGPDTVDEFLYEINALHALSGSDCVIQLEAIVLDDLGDTVKGLLISYAERGAIVDLLYDHKGNIFWEDRLRWAQQAIQGLSEIHEEGYVQGDFTLSNIVVDDQNNARIIDINRRGCPVGWEPPELAKKIASNQRISMYIGEKSDLYQLGMTLWALAMDDDEPERHDPPLSVAEFPSEIPDWYQEIVRTCLSPEPRDRRSAKELLTMFPQHAKTTGPATHDSRPSLTVHTERQYIDPAAAVERGDIERMRREPAEPDEMAWTSTSSVDDPTFTYPRSSNYEYSSESSYVERPRGRRRAESVSHGRPHSHIRQRLAVEDRPDESQILTPTDSSAVRNLHPDHATGELEEQLSNADGSAHVLEQAEVEQPTDASRQRVPDQAIHTASHPIFEPNTPTVELQRTLEQETPSTAFEQVIEHPTPMSGRQVVEEHQPIAEPERILEHSIHIAHSEQDAKTSEDLDASQVDSTPEVPTSLPPTMHAEGEPIWPDVPITHHPSSPISEDTPRNSTSPVTQLSISSFDHSHAELANLGAHPELDQYSPDEPSGTLILTPDPSEHDSSESPARSAALPAELAFTDSGFDEPSLLSSIDDFHRLSMKGSTPFPRSAFASAGARMVSEVEPDADPASDMARFQGSVPTELHPIAQSDEPLIQPVSHPDIQETSTNEPEHTESTTETAHSTN